MSWQGSSSLRDRGLAALPYLLPLVEGIGFGVFLFRQFPPLQLLLVPLMPLLQLTSVIPFFSLIVFFLLLFLVVRNTNISRFIRFNTMQAILLDIVLFLCQLGLSLVPGTGLVTETITNAVFLGMLAAVGFSVVQTLRGEYAQIPTISDAVNMQVP